MNRSPRDPKVLNPAFVALGARIKAAREAANFTQHAVANHFDVAVSTVSRWESGEIEPGGTVIAELAKLFGCSVESLLNESHAVEPHGSAA